MCKSEHLATYREWLSFCQRIWRYCSQWLSPAHSTARQWQRQPALLHSECRRETFSRHAINLCKMNIAFVVQKHENVAFSPITILEIQTHGARSSSGCTDWRTHYSTRHRGQQQTDRFSINSLCVTDSDSSSISSASKGHRNSNTCPLEEPQLLTMLKEVCNFK